MTNCNPPKLQLALVELYNPYRHGFHMTKENNNVYGHHIINYSIDINEFYNDTKDIYSDLKFAYENSIEFMNRIRSETDVRIVKHPTVRNYENIVKNTKQYELQLIQPITISVGDKDSDKYSAAIIKTHWVRIIQRRWRNIREKRIANMKNNDNLKYRETTGEFPRECIIPFRLGIT